VPRNQAKAYVFLDNLRMHHNHSLGTFAARKNIEFIFNGSYSSELNPAEIIFAQSKRYFARRLHQLEDIRDQKSVMMLVKQSLA
jgi:transposase